ncbi:MAG TPA: hypothetical protein VH912_21930 [Streptosporangiaceae bacterium]|jgi:hypothetical protein
MSTVTCHTEGCDNNGVPLQLDLTVYDPDTGQPAGTTSTVICGPCGQPITDIQDGAAS